MKVFGNFKVLIQVNAIGNLSANGLDIDFQAEAGDLNTVMNAFVSSFETAVMLRLESSKDVKSMLAVGPPTLWAVLWASPHNYYVKEFPLSPEIQRHVFMNKITFLYPKVFAESEVLPSIMYNNEPLKSTPILM